MMAPDDMDRCRYFWSTRATMDYPEECGCAHPESKGGTCGDEPCPLNGQEDADGCDA